LHKNDLSALQRGIPDSPQENFTTFPVPAVSLGTSGLFVPTVGNLIPKAVFALMPFTLVFQYRIKA
jgi:hypothetical protein